MPQVVHVGVDGDAALALDEEIDLAVRKKLASYSQKKLPGSREYEILYRKFYEEEVARRR